MPLHRSARRTRLAASDRDPARTNPTSAAMSDTGYGSESFLRACRVAADCRQVEGDGPRAAWARLRAGSLYLEWYRRQLPSVTLRLTASPAGRMIDEHFAIRERGDWRFRHAQGVLELPAEFSAYMRGRSRQAVRTNVAHARRSGFEAISYVTDNWAPGLDDTRAGLITPGTAERWTAFDADGAIVGESILSIDEDVALLQGLVSFTTHARWLLHTAIVERLCGECKVLLTNSDDAYLMNAGNQHFQRLLGYRISRLDVSRSIRPRPPGPPPHPAGLAWPSGQRHPAGGRPGSHALVAPRPRSTRSRARTLLVRTGCEGRTPRRTRTAGGRRRSSRSRQRSAPRCACCARRAYAW
jgi:hypothetical protein